MTTELERLLEIERELANLHNEIQIKGRIGASNSEAWSKIKRLEDEKESLKSQIESKLAQADKRLTDNMVKIVVCIKCNRHRTPYGYYPKTQCVCGSYESEERDTTLEELFAESKELSQLRPIVQALEDARIICWCLVCNTRGIPKDVNFECGNCNTKNPKDLIYYKEFVRDGKSILATSEVKSN